MVANSKMIFLMHISFNPIIIDCINLNSLNKRVSLVAVILFRNFGLSRKKGIKKAPGKC